MFKIFVLLLSIIVIDIEGIFYEWNWTGVQDLFHDIYIN